MTVKTKITFREYCSLLFGLMYKKPVLKIIVGVGLAMIIWIVSYYLHLLPVPKPEIYQYITLFLIFIVQPLVIFWTIKRNYDSSNQLREPLEISVTKDEINVRGESFYTAIVPEKIFKIDEIKNWFLLYQNNLSAILISKKDLTSEQNEELRKIFSTIRGIPVNLMEKE